MERASPYPNPLLSLVFSEAKNAATYLQVSNNLKRVITYGLTHASFYMFRGPRRPFERLV